MKTRTLCTWTIFSWFLSVHGQVENQTINPNGNGASVDIESKAKDFVDSLVRRVLPTVLRSSEGGSKVSTDCNVALFRLLLGLRQLDSWAIKVLDASGKLPGGVMKGTLTAFGSYDECVDISVPSKRGGGEDKLHFQGKYCSVQFHPPDGLFHKNKGTGAYGSPKNSTKSNSVVSSLQNYGDFLSAAYMRFGLCVPATCNDADVHSLVQSVMEKTGLSLKVKIRRCEVKSEFSMSRSQIAILSVLGLLATLVILGTILDNCRNKLGCVLRAITVFSMSKNMSTLFTVKRAQSEITSLDGIRFITSLWIILGHNYLLPLGVHYTRFRRVSGFANYQREFSFAAIGNFYLSVDTFFFISGLLLVYTKKSSIELSTSTPSFFKHILRRLWRISPVYFITIGVFILLPILGSGPMWYDAVESQADICKRSWWTNLLYIQNFWPIKENCMLHSWYLAATMQIHILSFFIFRAVLRSFPLGLFVNAVALVGSMAITGFVTFWYELKPTMDVLGGHKALEGVTSLIYTRPYSHLPAFSVGIFFGLLLIYKGNIKLSKVLIASGSAIALAVNMAVIFGLHDYYKGNPISSVETIIYAAFHKPAWAFSVGWLVFLCATGNAGIVNRVLSCKVFAPLAKLSFAAYLIHPLVILYQLGSSRERIYLGHFEMIMNSIAVSCVSYVFAIILHVGVEIPCINLEKMFLNAWSKRTKFLQNEEKVHPDSLPNPMPISVIIKAEV